MKPALGAALSLALVLLSGFVPAASAGPAIHLSRSVVDFQHVARAFTSPVQPVYVTNTGDAALILDSLTLGGTHADAFSLGGTCAAPGTLMPGEFCRVEIALRSTTYLRSVIATLAVASNAPSSPLVIDLVGYVEPNMTGVAFVTAEPNYLEFGQVPAGMSALQTITLTNVIPPRNVPPVPVVFNFTIASVRLEGDHGGDFAVASPCQATASFYVNESCVWTVTFTPGQPGLRTAHMVIDLVGIGGATGLALSYPYSFAGVGAAAAPATVVEYYNDSLDHYFITWLPAEIAVLDAGVQIRGWARTGQVFRTLPAPGAGTTAVCRFYIPPGKGDSHFFGRGAVECADTGTKNPTFVLEDPAFMHMYLPVAGACPPGTTRVYRVFSNRPDANHRYMTDPAIRDLMVSRGWLAEGDGADLVVMCTP